jgi:hypothetical protein
MYKLEFACAETGEHSDKGPYYTRDDALCAKDEPGYGSETIKEISDEEALNLIVDQITEKVWEVLNDEGLNPDDKNIFYPVFYAYIWEYHDQMQPGYELIPEYMKDKEIPTRGIENILYKVE